MERRRAAIVAVALVALTAAVRMHPFLEGNDDGDVGVYVLGARALLHGALPYTTIWEYKPPGLFALFALALAVAGDGSRAAALLGFAAAAATTLIVWRLVARIAPDGERAGLIAAVLWACLSIENDGLLGDAELLSVPFVAGALLALAGRRGGADAARAGSPGYARVALAGLLAACAVQMKLSVAPAVLVPAIAALMVRGPLALVPFAAGFAAPVALEAAIYALAHRFADFYDANAGATLRRIASRTAVRPLPRNFAAELRLLTPAWELAPFAALRANRWTGILALWLALAALTLVAVGEYDARQFLPLVAPLCALGGLGLDALARRVRRAGTALTIAALVVTFFLHGYFELNSSLRTVYMRDIRGERDWRISEVDHILAGLRGVPLARDGAWFVEVTPLAYDRLGVTPPTRYPLTSNLFNPALWPMLGFSGGDELRRIVDCARPRWVVMRTCGPWCDPAIRDMTVGRIVTQYRIERKLDRRTSLYRRVSTAAGRAACR
jgi:Dolichyl-phosphate-mannose-protein mannosyltransferase